MDLLIQLYFPKLIVFTLVQPIIFKNQGTQELNPTSYSTPIYDDLGPNKDPDSGKEKVINIKEGVAQGSKPRITTVMSLPSHKI